MRLKESLGAAFAILISAILFLVPFVLIILTAVKDRQESSEHVQQQTQPWACPLQVLGRDHWLRRTRSSCRA
jgi:ABC-type glycerol-3-phosphate transport system permease component